MQFATQHSRHRWEQSLTTRLLFAFRRITLWMWMPHIFHHTASVPLSHLNVNIPVIYTISLSISAEIAHIICFIWASFTSNESNRKKHIECVVLIVLPILRVTKERCNLAYTVKKMQKLFDSIDLIQTGHPLLMDQNKVTDHKRMHYLITSHHSVPSAQLNLT